MLGLIAGLALLNISFLTSKSDMGSVAFASQGDRVELTDKLTVSDLKNCGLGKTCNASIKSKVGDEEIEYDLDLSISEIKASTYKDEISGQEISIKADRVAEAGISESGCDECKENLQLLQSEKWKTTQELVDYLNAEVKKRSQDVIRRKKEEAKRLADYKKCKRNMDGTKMDREERAECRAEQVAEKEKEMEDKLFEYALSDDSKDQRKLKSLLDDQIFGHIAALISKGEKERAEELFQILAEYQDDPLVAQTMKNLMTYRQAEDYRTYMQGQMDMVHRTWSPGQAKDLRLEQLREQMNKQLQQMISPISYRNGNSYSQASSAQQQIMQRSLIDGIRPQGLTLDSNLNASSQLNYSSRFGNDQARLSMGLSRDGTMGNYGTSALPDTLNYQPINGPRGATTFGTTRSFNAQWRTSRQ